VHLVSADSVNKVTPMKKRHVLPTVGLKIGFFSFAQSMFFKVYIDPPDNGQMDKHGSLRLRYRAKPIASQRTNRFYLGVPSTSLDRLCAFARDNLPILALFGL
jgi:hypothetical protein